MTTNVEADLTKKLETSSLEAAQHEIPISKDTADALKAQANEAFKNGDYDTATELYSKAIEIYPDAILYSNRSFAYLRREWYGYALIDAKKALEYDSKYIKAFYRRASAYMALGKYPLALNDYEYVKKVCPNDKDALLKYEECKKIVTRIRFEKAIAVDESTKSVVNQIDLNSMTIEKEYDGPHLDAEGRVTKEFMFELLPYFENQKKLHKKYAYQIILQILTLLKTLPSLIDITVPSKHKFTICGDVHGQFYDLLNIFKLNGPPSDQNPYLFNGDFVDRGSFSMECILTLFGFKLLYPDHFFLARGNHESLTMNQMYGFEGEVKAKYTVQMFQLFTEVFNYLPLSHCINNKVLVMHGGLFSKDDVTLKDIRAIERVKQPPEDGLMSEILWSDPQPQNGRSESKRGVGLQFGPDVTERFLKFNNLEYVVRSHEVKQEGYELAHNGKCITVFSAPNYCDSMGNKGAYITITGDDVRPKFTSYTAVPHPPVRPMMYANQLSMFDNRVAVESSAYPWSAVGKLSTGCTGTLVGSDLVLTAAHCVIDSKTHALSTKSLYFYANMIDGKSSHQAFVSHIWWGTTDPNTNRNKDWALLRLDKKLGDTQGWLGVRMLSTNTMITTPGTLVGYSADFRNSKTAGAHIGCSITKQLKDDLFIHNCDMTRGASGGPIFANWNGSPYIYALNVAEFRHGGDQSLQIWNFNDNEANVAMWSVELMNKINSLKQS
ncbi:unnamed protein product [Adineta steineri]|uniref:protein-serine/threonine phosphatase n=1 Tax=Adineta steineri TaxID=433720 RepID=A0A814BXU7_9BILA|nr:unnamed protein product [Adineta steineri]